jgi:hypothetical protein
LTVLGAQRILDSEGGLRVAIPEASKQARMSWLRPFRLSD